MYFYLVAVPVHIILDWVLEVEFIIFVMISKYKWMLFCNKIVFIGPLRKKILGLIQKQRELEEAVKSEYMYHHKKVLLIKALCINVN